MKKVFFAVFVLAALFLVLDRSNAQTATFKVRVFDIDIMVRPCPNTVAVDSITQIIRKRYPGFRIPDLSKRIPTLDSTYKSDSAVKKPKRS